MHRSKINILLTLAILFAISMALPVMAAPAVAPALQYTDGDPTPLEWGVYSLAQTPEGLVASSLEGITRWTGRGWGTLCPCPFTLPVTRGFVPLHSTDGNLYAGIETALWRRDSAGSWQLVHDFGGSMGGRSVNAIASFGNQLYVAVGGRLFAGPDWAEIALPAPEYKGADFAAIVLVTALATDGGALWMLTTEKVVDPNADSKASPYVLWHTSRVWGYDGTSWQKASPPLPWALSLATVDGRIFVGLHAGDGQRGLFEVLSTRGVSPMGFAARRIAAMASAGSSLYLGTARGDILKILP